MKYAIKIINGSNKGKYLASNAYGSPKFRKSISAKSVYKFSSIDDADRLRNSFTEVFKNLTEIIEVKDEH